MDKFKKSQKLNKNNLSEMVTGKLEDMILDGILKVGEKLPSEKEVAEFFGVSRNSVREAFVSLRERGLIEVKPGLGAFVIEPEGKLGDVVHRLVRLSSITKQDIYEVRRCIEVSAAGYAAVRADNDDIEKINLITRKMKNIKDISDWQEAEINFHITIAEISQNPLYYLLIKDIYDILSDFFKEIYSKKKDIDTYKDHIYIVEAIKSGDKKAAQQAMLNHISDSQHVVLDEE